MEYGRVTGERHSIAIGLDTGDIDVLLELLERAKVEGRELQAAMRRPDLPVLRPFAKESE